MRRDQDIKSDILDELEWDPEVDVADVGITVVDGAVTLRGTVPSYAARRAAERAVRRVRGVVTIAQDLRVELANDFVEDDMFGDSAHLLLQGAWLFEREVARRLRTLPEPVE